MKNRNYYCVIVLIPMVVALHILIQKMLVNVLVNIYFLIVPVIVLCLFIVTGALTNFISKKSMMITTKIIAFSFFLLTLLLFIVLLLNKTVTNNQKFSTDKYLVESIEKRKKTAKIFFLENKTLFRLEIENSRIGCINTSNPKFVVVSYKTSFMGLKIIQNIEECQNDVPN